jgi:hypothetical protein
LSPPGRLVAQQHHVDPIARQGVAADAGVAVDLDGVGAHALGDLGGDGRARAGARQFGRQQGFAGGDGGEHDGGAAMVLGERRGDGAERAFGHGGGGDADDLQLAGL